MISQFLVYIRGGLGLLFSYLYLSGGLTFFGDKEKSQRERKYILDSLFHSHLYTHLSLAPPHCHAYSRTNILILLVPSCYFHHLQIAGI